MELSRPDQNRPDQLSPSLGIQSLTRAEQQNRAGQRGQAGQPHTPQHIPSPGSKSWTGILLYIQSISSILLTLYFIPYILHTAHPTSHTCAPYPVFGIPRARLRAVWVGGSVAEHGARAQFLGAASALGPAASTRGGVRSVSNQPCICVPKYPGARAYHMNDPIYQYTKS